MEDILKDIETWISQDKSVALATVIRTWGSSPRGVGAKMAVSSKGEMAGSVSGGCVEGAVVQAAVQTIRSGMPQRLHFGVSDETAWDVGLACGGEIDIFVRPLDVDAFDFLCEHWRKGETVWNWMVVGGAPDYLGLESLQTKTEVADRQSHPALDQLRKWVTINSVSGLETIPINETESLEIFVDVIQPSPKLIVVGGVHIAVSLVTFANALGYRTIVVDPRRQFASPERFYHANEIIHAWPETAFSQIQINASTAVAALTHDPKLDDPALELALPSPAFYVGALGSKGTQSQRRERLLGNGLSQAHIDRLHGPIGLDLGGRSPEEIGLSIMAEITQVWNQRL